MICTYSVELFYASKDSLILSRTAKSSSIFATMRFCSARGGRDIGILPNFDLLTIDIVIAEEPSVRVSTKVFELQ